jgi:hypothetical protein
MKGEDYYHMLCYQYMLCFRLQAMQSYAEAEYLLAWLLGVLPLLFAPLVLLALLALVALLVLWLRLLLVRTAAGFPRCSSCSSSPAPVGSQSTSSHA